MSKANDIQHGGNHYKKGGSVQHWDWVAREKLCYYTGCASKYVTRFRDKNGVEDLNKAGHFIQKLMELFEDGKVLGRARPGRVDDFAKANGLDALQTRFCEICVTWQDTMDLMEALAVVDALKKQL